MVDTYFRFPNGKAQICRILNGSRLYPSCLWRDLRMIGHRAVGRVKPMEIFDDNMALCITIGKVYAILSVGIAYRE